MAFYVDDVLYIYPDSEGRYNYPNNNNFTGEIRFLGQIQSSEWLKNGQFHRDPDPITGEELPAIIDDHGNLKFYFKHNLHRMNGPAVIESTGYQEWWCRGVFYGNYKFKPANFPKR